MKSLLKSVAVQKSSVLDRNMSIFVSMSDFNDWLGPCGPRAGPKHSSIRGVAVQPAAAIVVKAARLAFSKLDCEIPAFMYFGKFTRNWVLSEHF